MNINILLAILGLGQTAGGYALNQSRRIHARLAGIFLASMALVLVEVFFNLIGLRFLNLIILLVCNIVLIIALSRPEIVGIFIGTHLGACAVAGAANPNVNMAQGAIQGIQVGWNRYIHVVVEILLWFSVISLFLGTIPLWGRFWAALLIICAIIVMYYVTIQLNQPRIFYKVAKGYAYIILIVGIMLAISPATYVKFFGFDVLAFARISNFESAVAKAERVDRERTERLDSEKLEILVERIKRVGIEGLSPAEKKLWSELKNKRDKETIPSKVSGLGNSVGEFLKKAEPNPVWAGDSKKDQLASKHNLNSLVQTSVKTINENEWEIVHNPSDNGWIAEVDIKKGGKFKISASGEYQRAFSDNDKIHWEKYFPDGRRRPAKKLACYAGKLLSEDLDFGLLLARINRSEIVQVGMETEISVPDDSKIEFGVNTESNDQWNRGGPLIIKIKRIG